MEKHNAPELPADGSLPRPVVLQAEDLAAVAAAGMSLAVSPALGAKAVIAGGIPAIQVMSAAAF